MLDHIKRRSPKGWVVLILVALPLLDTYGMLTSMAGRHMPVVLGLGLAGFTLGAVLGAVVSVKVKRQAWWSSCRWAIYGLLGMCVLTFPLFGVVLRRQ
jgi:hypothetical protein